MALPIVFLLMNDLNVLNLHDLSDPILLYALDWMPLCNPFHVGGSFENTSYLTCTIPVTTVFLLARFLSSCIVWRYL